MATKLRPYVLDPICAVHILSGDAKGGGHRFGAGQGKSEFPRTWSDVEILTAITEVANDARSISTPGRSGRLIFLGVRQGVRIKVVADQRNRAIITGFPA